MSLFVALLVLSFLVFFHELGHFIVARLFGVRVEVFSIGFGKKLLTFHTKHTQYAFSLIPLGGYVKLKGQDDSNPKLEQTSALEADSYLAKSPCKRIAILLAGAGFNFLLAFILYVIVGINGIPSLAPIVGDVRENTPAFTAGLQPNDRIVGINGTHIRTWEELDSIITESNGSLNVEIMRKSNEQGQIAGSGAKIIEKQSHASNELAQERIQLTLTPIVQDSKNIFGEPIKRRMIGIVSANALEKVHYYGLDSLYYGWHETLKASVLIIQGIGKLISGVVPSSQVGGVISIVSVIDVASRDNLSRFLYLVALISVNLGVLNLLPIPALDGGHILFNAYEMLRGKKPNEQVAYYLTLCGWAVLLGLMMLGLYNDIFRLLA